MVRQTAPVSPPAHETQTKLQVPGLFLLRLRRTVWQSTATAEIEFAKEYCDAEEQIRVTLRDTLRNFFAVLGVGRCGLTI
jgi:hypothetical protein